MWDDEKEEEPQEPEMQNASRVVSAEHRRQPTELHGLVNRPTRGRGKKAGHRYGEIGRALERVIQGVELGRPPFTAANLANGKTQ